MCDTAYGRYSRDTVSRGDDHDLSADQSAPITAEYDSRQSVTEEGVDSGRFEPLKMISGLFNEFDVNI